MSMSTRSRAVWSVSLAAALWLLGCATMPSTPVPAAQPESGGIGIAVRLAPPLGPARDGEAVYFVRLDAAGQPADRTIQLSNVSRDGRLYLLNVPPGRYAAVAAHFTTMGTTYVTYLSQAAIAQTTVEVTAGGFVHAGRLSLDMGMFVCPDSADEAQLRWAEAIAPGVPKCGLVRILLHEIGTHPIMVVGGSAFTLGPSTYHYRGVLREATRSEADLLTLAASAREDLKDGGWSARLQ